MIRIRRSVPDIAREVERQLSGWQAKADLLALEDRDDGRHVPRASEHWLKIRDFIADPQYGKCGYCERYLGQAGSESTVDHYRPKGRVLVWRTKSADFSDQPKDKTNGYFRLAYYLENYVGACERCNRTKSSYFPVRSARRLEATHGLELAKEQPLLLHPADASDPDPEDLISFFGPLPQLREGDDGSRLRALATIEILKLATREDIIYSRCVTLKAVWLAYRDRDRQDEWGELARETLAECGKPKMDHSNCAKSFLLLIETRPGRANDLANLINRYVSKKIRFDKFLPELREQREQAGRLGER